MKLKNSEKKENNEVEIVIEIETEELDTAVNKAYIKNRNRIAVPGFRKGKAPRKMIEKMYGTEIFLSDALDDILPGALDFAMKETDHDVVGYPKISDVDVKDNNCGVEITLIAALHPEVILEQYKGLSAPKPVVEVTESEVDAEIESMRQRNARIEKADKAAENGDIAVIDYEGFVDNEPFEGGKGENYELTLGSGQFIPGFEEKVEGMTAGEERDIDLVFPEQYKEDLAGKPVVFKVRLNEVKEKILPDLDDEFAKDVSEFDSLDEYKTDIKERKLKLMQQDVDETFENILMDQIIESMQADIPEAMIEEQLDHSMNNMSRQMSAYGMQPAQYMKMMGVTPEQFKERMRGNSEKQVKVTLALEKIAELENIKINDDEIDEEYKDAAARYKMEVDKLKETVTSKDITRELKMRKAVKIISESAIAIDVKKDDLKDESKKSVKSKSTVKVDKKSKASAKTSEKESISSKTNEKTDKNEENIIISKEDN